MLSMNAYSRDLRLRVLAAVDRDIPRKEVADLFGVSLSTIKTLVEEEAPDGRCEHLQDPRQTLGERQGFEKVAARAPPSEP